MLASYVRGDFPGLARYRAYLNTAALGLVPRDPLNEYVRASLLLGEDPLGVEGGIVERLREAEWLLERLYRLPRGEIAWGESTTHMILRVATAALRHLGSRDIVVGEEEFPGVVYALASWCRGNGCRVHTHVTLLATTTGWSQAEALDHPVVVASSVTWVTGYRLDASRLARRIHKLGGALVLDAIQHAGALPLEPLLEADALCASSKKWLLAPHSGLAFCRVHPRLHGAIPEYYGLNNVDVGDRNRFWLDPWKSLEPPEPVAGAWRFNAPSGIGVLAVEALVGVLRYLSRVPVEAVEDHIHALHHALLDLLEDAGIGYHGLPREKWSGIVLVETGLEPPGELELARRLASQGISVSARGQAGKHGIRVSLHLYNSLDDLEELVEALRRLLHR